jgi:hypothetical protein
MKTLLLSLGHLILRIVVAGQIHSGPICTTLFVFARFFVSYSFETIPFACDFAICSRNSISHSGWRCFLVRTQICSWRNIPYNLISSLDWDWRLLFSITAIPFIWVDVCYCLFNLWPGFPLSVCSNLVHVIQCESVGVPLCFDFLQVELL